MFLPPEALSVQADIPGSITLLNLIEAGCCSWAEALEDYPTPENPVRFWTSLSGSSHPGIKTIAPIARIRDRERAIMRS